jgi:hypothetical protein
MTDKMTIDKTADSKVDEKEFFNTVPTGVETNHDIQN